VKAAAARRHPSLRLRLLASTLAWVLLVVLLAGWGLRALLRAHITQQLHAQLVLHLNQLSAAVNIAPDGSVEIERDDWGDVRLHQPLSGLYWQIDRLDGSAGHSAILRSRSLWDQTLDWAAFVPYTRLLPAAWTGTRALDADVQTGFLPDANSQRGSLVAVSRRLQLPEAAAPPLRLMVAADGALLAEPMQRFTALLVAALGMLALGLVLAVVLQLGLALRPLRVLRQRLAQVRTGQAARLHGHFAQELQPLVEEFNRVLDVNADMVQHARTRAGNLAHAINTPLTILGNAAAQQDSALAILVREQVASASRQIKHHLARERTAARQVSGVYTPLQPALASLVLTMRRLHAAHALQFTLTQPQAPWDFHGDVQDLLEILGNLLDNAGKWARQRVHLHAQGAGEHIVLTVDDDGPGIPAAQRERIFARGQRLDERPPGWGLGLDIVRELVHGCGGTIAASASPWGGLRMQLRLPGRLRG